MSSGEDERFCMGHDALAGVFGHKTAVEIIMRQMRSDYLAKPIRHDELLEDEIQIAAAGIPARSKRNVADPRSSSYVH